MSKARLVRFVAACGLVMLVAGLLSGVLLSDALASEPGEGAAKTPLAPNVQSMLAIAAAVSVAAGLAGAGYAVGRVGAAALGAASERPEIIGRALLFVAMGEGIAVLGLVAGILLIGKL